jgi:curved DNA-binding protein CbpA
MADLYETLGVGRDASVAEVRRAYRGKAKAAHPDAGGSAEAFAEIARAVAVLSDPGRRERYDRTGKIDEAVDTLPARALQAIAGAFEGVLQEVQGAADLAAVDWVGAIRARLSGAQKRGQAEKAKAEAVLVRLERLVGRFKAKGPENHLAAMVDNRVARQREHVTAIDANIEPLGLALEMLKAYRFDVERPPQQSSYQPLGLWNAPAPASGIGGGLGWR